MKSKLYQISSSSPLMLPQHRTPFIELNDQLLDQSETHSRVSTNFLFFSSSPLINQLSSCLFEFISILRLGGSLDFLLLLCSIRSFLTIDFLFYRQFCYFFQVEELNYLYFLHIEQQAQINIMLFQLASRKMDKIIQKSNCEFRWFCQKYKYQDQNFQLERIVVHYYISNTCQDKMSTANRFKHKKKSVDQQPDERGQPAPVMPTPVYVGQQKPKAYSSSNHKPKQQKQYESYYEIGQCNPNGVTTTSTLFPHSHQMHSSYNVPLGFLSSPLLFLENQHAEVMQKSADRIPRCSVCRAYMNCYNKINGKKFQCFMCSRESQIEIQYNPQQQPHMELDSSIYQAIGPTNFYPKQPNQQVFVFLIDINSDSASCKMLFYAIAAMKQVLARPQLDDICIYFFTFDQVIQQYDLSGEQIKCTIIDQTIQGQLSINLQSCYLKDIRKKLFDMLDALEEISLNNSRKGSSFSKVFQYVFNALRHLGPKFFIFQANEAIAGEPQFQQERPKQVQNGATGVVRQPQSLFQTRNKVFFEKYVNLCLNFQCSFSYFVFLRNYKNTKTVHDMLKLTSSQLKVYLKDSPIQLEKFYYELSYLLGAQYFRNVRTQYIISAGWHFTAIYGNFYRTANHISFQMNSLEPSRKIFTLVLPSASNQYPYPYCAIQINTNYRYKRQSYICVSTIVQPVTGYLDRLYQSIDSNMCISAMGKGLLSSLRMDSMQIARKKLIESLSLIYNCALREHKKAQNIPDSILSIIMGGLAMVKSIHSQPQTINNTILMDKVNSERNFLQFCGTNDLSPFFNPYLFDVSDLDETMCREDAEFVYPPVVQLKFNNVKEGLFLLDNGISLFLFIAKQCKPQILADVFGKSKLSKNDELNQQLLNQQQNFRVSQILYLIKFLRQQKSYGWVPLYIIRCGQNTLNERNFYLQFYPEKYEEYRNYKVNLQEFTAMLLQNNTF